MADRLSRRAALWATMAATPLALLAGLGVFAAMSDSASDGPAADPEVSASPSASPQATGPVTVAAPKLAERAELVCRALLSRLPDRLRDRVRRPVTAGPEQNAAYGDPAITLSCGAPAATFPPTDEVYLLDRVCWHAARTAQGTVWTTVDREVPVRVTMPPAYAEPGQWVIEFSAPMIAAVSPIDQPPGGCAG